MWCTLWHRLWTELCLCRPEGHGGVAESLHWIWGRAQTLTLPRDGIFARSCKHDHQAGRVASGVGGVSGPAHDRARENNTFFGGVGVGCRGWRASTFIQTWRANVISITALAAWADCSLHVQTWWYQTLYIVTHYFLVGGGLPCSELEILPSDYEEEEEGQHEELPVPHCHKEDLRRQSTGPAFKNISAKQNREWI